MGNTATKFRKALVNGDEALAWQLYEGNPQFRDGLDPNASYGEPYQHNTALHYACRHAMTRLLRYPHTHTHIHTDTHQHTVWYFCSSSLPHTQGDTRCQCLALGLVKE